MLWVSSTVAFSPLPNRNVKNTETNLKLNNMSVPYDRKNDRQYVILNNAILKHKQIVCTSVYLFHCEKNEKKLAFKWIRCDPSPNPSFYERNVTKVMRFIATPLGFCLNMFTITMKYGSAGSLT